MAQAPCANDWSVKVGRFGDDIEVVLKETTPGSNGCDLIVKSMNYFEGAAILALELAVPRFCPLDVVTERAGKLRWQLPQELREQGEMRLVVNGGEIGRLTIRSGETAFRGGCQ